MNFECHFSATDGYEKAIQKVSIFKLKRTA
jgi:hypothetical protein